MNDTTLTSGAHFGFGHWNSGTTITDGSGTVLSGTDQRSCHYNAVPDCTYYRGWDGEHPAGQSVLCQKDSCLMV